MQFIEMRPAVRVPEARLTEDGSPFRHRAVETISLDCGGFAGRRRDRTEGSSATEQSVMVPAYGISYTSTRATPVVSPTPLTWAV
jgi:hypothetical protein